MKIAVSTVGQPAMGEHNSTSTASGQRRYDARHQLDFKAQRCRTKKAKDAATSGRLFSTSTAPDSRHTTARIPVAEGLF
ncbi:hypothetical protein [Aquabacterium sp.]|uniref:hypothetical protein n=1 Tax=Aquabacterium sp. TaxID=1872578 RepID=UPI0019A943ED|nr:hypothetical protein [Aquabacterium sp.]MBC7700334.1 hypothetical protein [Aquabacterium sp.]